MSKPPLVQFISDNRATGKTDSEITHMLLDAGWQMDVIQKAMHGDPIRHRNLDPILDIKKQPFRKSSIITFSAILIMAALVLAALYI